MRNALLPLGLAALLAPLHAQQFEPPVRLTTAEGTVIDTEIGHADPHVADFDGDGVRDLLVGQFGSGLLWIHRNAGSDADWQLEEGVKFQDGRPDGRVPTG